MKHTLLIITALMLIVGCSTHETETWLIGTWSTSSDEVEFKLTVNPDGKGRMYMLGSWHECTYKVFDNTLVATRNDVDVQFKLDKMNNRIYMGGGNELTKW